MKMITVTNKNQIANNKNFGQMIKLTVRKN